MIALAGKIAAKNWEIQKVVTSPGVEDKLKAAIEGYKARPVDVPSPQMTEASATPLIAPEKGRAA